MTGWLIFYIISFSLLLLPRKVIYKIYPWIYFVFVGFRDNIGTDCPPTLNAVERSYMPWSEFANNFIGYGALDLELNHKLISMTLSSFALELKWYFVFLAGIESIVIWFILKKANNTKIFLLYFICLYTMNLAMNQMRQGLCFVFIVLAFLFEFKSYKHSKLWSSVSYLLGIASHYASTIIVAMCAFKIKNVATYVVLGLLLLIAVKFVDFDLLDSRYGGAEGQYALKGLGLRRFFFLGYYLYSVKVLFKESFFTQETITLLMVFAMIPFVDAFVRLFNFYLYLLCFRNVIKLDCDKIKGGTLSLLSIFPLMAWCLEFFEIYRSPVLYGLGIWFPYSNWLLEVM